MKTPLFCIAVSGLLLIISSIRGANNLQAAEDLAAAGDREAEMAAFKKHHHSSSLSELKTVEEADYQAFKAGHASKTLGDLRKELEELRKSFLEQLIECPTIAHRPPLDLQPFLERLINEKEGEEFTRYYKSFEDDSLLEVYVKNFTGAYLTTGGVRFAEEKISYAEITKRGLCEQLNTLVARQELEKKALATSASS